MFPLPAAIILLLTNFAPVFSKPIWQHGVVLVIGAGAPLIVGVDDTLERRRGDQIKAKGVFRDAVRSSRRKVVTSFGLRWVCMMLVVPLPWSRRPWALPFLTTF